MRVPPKVELSIHEIATLSAFAMAIRMPRASPQSPARFLRSDSEAVAHVINSQDAIPPANRNLSAIRVRSKALIEVAKSIRGLGRSLAIDRVTAAEIIRLTVQGKTLNAIRFSTRRMLVTVGDGDSSA